MTQKNAVLGHFAAEAWNRAQKTTKWRKDFVRRWIFPYFLYVSSMSHNSPRTIPTLLCSPSLPVMDSFAPQLQLKSDDVVFRVISCEESFPVTVGDTGRTTDHCFPIKSVHRSSSYRLHCFVAFCTINTPVSVGLILLPAPQLYEHCSVTELWTFRFWCLCFSCSLLHALLKQWEWTYMVTSHCHFIYADSCCHRQSHVTVSLCIRWFVLPPTESRLDVTLYTLIRAVTCRVTS
jgi:hypothetical protein